MLIINLHTLAVGAITLGLVVFLIRLTEDYPAGMKVFVGLVIGAGIAVHRELGPGLDEPIYEEAFCAELRSMGIEYLRQEPMPLVYKNVKLDCGYRLDVVIDWKLIIELKSVETVLMVRGSTHDVPALGTR